MLVQQAYRYELKPNNKQRTLLAKHAGTARFAYNWGLARRIKEYQETGKSSNAIKQHRQLNALKKTEYPWMYEVSKCAPQEALRNLHQAYQNFFRDIKKGKKNGFPKFKKKGVNDSFRLMGSIHVFDKTVQLPRIGVVRTKESTDVRGRILSVTVNREADRWYVSLAVEKERDIPQNTSDVAVGIDLGLESFAALSSGQKLSNPRYLKHSLRLLQRRSKQHSRKQKGSKNRKKSALKLACLHRRVRNQRRDFLHKLSSELAKTKSVIAMEDLNVKGLVRNKYLSRVISDVGWAEFKAKLVYKTLWYGSKLLFVDAFFPSSKICSRCGYLKAALQLSERVFKCDRCELEIDRDVNAACNILKEATGSSPGSYACGDTSGGGTQSNLWSTSHVSLKQEADTKFSSGIFG
ncbi:MAG: transposase [Candidatus Omnitrophica bacterium]|nr:transposase [Candidatus Omnitrophota bacterium]